MRKGKVGLQQVMHFQCFAYALEGPAADLSCLNREFSLALAKKEQVTDAALQGKHKQFSTGFPHPAHNAPSPPSLRRPPRKKEARARLMPRSIAPDGGTLCPICPVRDEATGNPRGHTTGDVLGSRREVVGTEHLLRDMLRAAGERCKSDVSEPESVIGVGFGGV